jgi:hypothetical protein
MTHCRTSSYNQAPSIDLTLYDYITVLETPSNIEVLREKLAYSILCSEQRQTPIYIANKAEAYLEVPLGLFIGPLGILGLRF